MAQEIAVYLGIPIVSALIGWLTNRLAVKMIFRPRKPVRLLGMEFIGLIPKRKNELARKIAETVEKELISHQDIHLVVTSERFREDILEAILSKIEEFIYVNLGSSPLVALMLSGEAAMRIKELIRNELRKNLPEVIENLFEKIESQIDFKQIIQSKIEAFDLRRFEVIIYSIAARELKAIELIGGILGLFIGIGQVAFLLIVR